jgi:hypothetical protein
MQNSSDRISLVPVPIPFPRGVFSYIEEPSGRTVYFAVTSTGALLNGELRHRLDDETDAMIRDEMRKDLDRQDALGNTSPTTVRPQLSVASGGLSRRARRGPSRPG